MCWHHATGEEYHEFDDYGELKAFFDGEFERLRREGAIRSAWINKDGETAVFKWDLEIVESAPLKFEIYLTEPEREALERFKAQHAECHRRYPRGPGVALHRLVFFGCIDIVFFLFLHSV